MAKKIQTLNIGTMTVELAEYELGGKGQLTLQRYGVTKLDAPLDFETAETILAPALMGLVRETGIRPGPVALAVPGQSVFTKFAAVPRAGGSEKFEQMIRYEIEQGIPFPIDEMICDRQVLGETENGDTSVMIVAAKTDQVEALTKAVSSVGFRPELVDAAPGALTNAVLFLHPEVANSCAITLWLASKATSLIITEGDKVYTRLIPIGANALTKEISVACGCSTEEAEQLRDEKAYVALGGVTEDEDEVADRVSKACRAVMTRLNAEINRSVNFYRSQQHGSAPTKVYLTGGMALLPQIDAFFSDALGIDVEFLNPFDAITVGPAVDATALETDAAYLASTAGLAAQVAGAARYMVNLLPPSIVSERAEKAKIPVLAAGGLGLAVALVLVGLGIGKETVSIEQQRDELQTKVAKLESFDKDVSKAQSKLETAKAEAESLSELLKARQRAVNQLKTVRSALLPGMWIHSFAAGKLTIRYWEDRMKKESGEPVSRQFFNRLTGKAEVDKEKTVLSNMTAIGEDCKEFTVEVKFK